MEPTEIPVPKNGSLPKKFDWLKIGLIILPIVIVINIAILISAAKRAATFPQKKAVSVLTVSPSPSSTTPTPDINKSLNPKDWQIQKITNKGAFNYPGSWQIIEKTPDLYQNQPFVKTCTGPLLQNTAEPTTIIAVEINDLLKDKEFTPCWKSGNFSETYTRKVKTLDPPKDINVVKWRSGEEEVTTGGVQKNLWHGELLEEFSFTNQSKTNRIIFALLYQGNKDRTAELTFDRLLSTFAFVDDDPLLLNPNWKNKTLELYGINLSFPSLWSLQEINQRPPLPTLPITHDCADYIITSSNGYVALTLKMPCGYALNNVTNIVTETRYFGPEDKKASYLQVSDQIVKSIKKL